VSKCCEGKPGESVCGQGDGPVVQHYLDADCPDCLRRLIESDRRYIAILEDNAAAADCKVEVLRGAIKRWSELVSTTSARLDEIAREGR